MIEYGYIEIDMQDAYYGDYEDNIYIGMLDTKTNSMDSKYFTNTTRESFVPLGHEFKISHAINGYYIANISDIYLHKDLTMKQTVGAGNYMTRREAVETLAKYNKNRPKYIKIKYMQMSRKCADMFKDIGLEVGTMHPCKNTMGFEEGKKTLLVRHLIDGDVKIGKVIKSLFPDMGGTTIEGYVSAFKTKFNIDLNSVIVSDDIGQIYNISSCGGSCMAHADTDWFNIYKDAGSSIAYILDDNLNLAARALLHKVVDTNGKTYNVLDRIFSNDKISELTLQAWGRANGYVRFKSLENDVRTVNSIANDYPYGIPYIDNLYIVIEFDGEYYLATDSNSNWSEYDRCQETGGGSEGHEISSFDDNMVYCCDSEDYVSEDYVYFCETDGNHYESPDELVYIDGYGYFRMDDENVAMDEYDDEWDFTENLKYCESECIHTSSNDYVLIERGSYEGSYEDIANLYYCEDIGEYIYDSADVQLIEDLDEYWYNWEDMAFEHSDGLYYSYEEEEEETEEEETKSEVA